MLDTKRHWFKGIEKMVGKLFGSLPLYPNDYTVFSGIMAVFACFSISRGDLIVGIVFFLIASILDFVDGAVARHKKMSTKMGAYLDTIFDRYVEGLILFGMLFLTFPVILLPGSAWIFLILFGSVVTTYAKAAAKEKELVNQELKGGMMSRGERLILLFLALVLGVVYPDHEYMLVVLIIIAILSNITAVQRVWSAISQNK